VSALERDPATTAATLARWLTTVGGRVDVAVSEVAIPGSTGWSNETVLFEARWRGSGDGPERHELVARIAPTSHTVFPDATFTEQYDVMAALDRHTDVPMASIHWLEPSTDWFGAPFWIMDRVRGDVPSDAPPYAGSGWIHDAQVDDQARVWSGGIEAMARVHRVDLARVDVGPLPIPSGSDPLGAQLDHYQRFLGWAEASRPLPVARRALEVLRATAPDLPPEGPALSWGDARLSNLIYRDFEVAAVLDWEMAGVADPLLDLGWWLFADDALTHGSGCRRVPGFAGRDDTAAMWSELTGRSTAELAYYELLAGFRFTVIMLRMGQLLADIGLVDEGFGHDNLISQALATQLD
jgi:aminoglycoside phosphotransferase (APT) family kinase protein